jgi:hypothetical protein
LSPVKIYKAKYPDRKPVHVQSLVEKSKMYVFGQSKSTDIDQMSYTPTRIQDLQTLDLPTVGSRQFGLEVSFIQVINICLWNPIHQLGRSSSD